MGARPVTQADLDPHFRNEPPQNGVAEQPSAATRALERALRMELFIGEAKRRKLRARGNSKQRRRASLYQALIRDELKRHGVGRDKVTEDEARAYYKDRAGEFNKVTARTARAIFVKTPAEAERVYGLVRNATDAQFADAAKKHSVHASASNGGDVGELRPGAPGPDAELVRLSIRLRYVGAVAGPARMSDGTWAVVRATSLEMKPKPWTEEVSANVRNRLARNKRNQVLDDLYQSLRGSASIRVFQDELAFAKPPPPKDHSKRPAGAHKGAAE